MTIRVLLADDHAVVRAGIHEFLEAEADITVVGEVTNGEEAVQFALQLQPDVVVLDIKMPVVSGVEAAQRLRAAAPQIHILVLTAYDDQPYVWRLLEAGVTGYVLKTAESRELIQAVRAVAAGKSALDPVVASHVLGRVAQPVSRVAALTDRELEVLRWTARGLTNKQIGRELGISNRTVQNHLVRIFAKLGVASRTEAVTVGMRSGLLGLGES